MASSNNLPPGVDANGTARNVATTDVFTRPVAPKRRMSKGQQATPQRSNTNNNDSQDCDMQHKADFALDSESLNLRCDSLSMTSRASRSSRFMRQMSTRKSKAAAWLSARLRRHQKGNDLSATFNLLDQENKGMLVDLNSATEEELMTVSGISRYIARSIVEYRTAIGGFRRLQDLALVSGVGAAKMAQLCRDFTVLDASDPANDENEENLGDDCVSLAPTPSPASNSLVPPSSYPNSHLSSPYSHLSSTYSSSLSSPSPTPLPYGSPHPKGTPIRRVNVNTASIFDLMTVPGINQEMAAAILHHREKRGPFKAAEDLTKVRGIRSRVTKQLLPHLTVSQVNSTVSSASQADCSSLTAVSSDTVPGRVPDTVSGRRPDSTPGGRSDNKHLTKAADNKHLRKAQYMRHRRTLSAPSHHNNSNSAAVQCAAMLPSVPPVSDTEVVRVIEEAVVDEQLTAPPPSGGHRLSLEFSSDLYELLSLRSERPESHGVFENCHRGRDALRLATWSLCHLTPDKISNAGVMEVLCRTVLERGFSLVAFQDILGATVLDRICEELNSGSLRRVREWPGDRGKWAHVVSSCPVGLYSLKRAPSSSCNEYVGFLFNENVVQFMGADVLTLPGSYSLVSKPHVGRFKCNQLSLTIMNIHGKVQNYIDRSESFLQTCDYFLTSQQRSHQSHFKANKDLHNGYLKESATHANGVLEQMANGSSDKKLHSRDVGSKEHLEESLRNTIEGLQREALLQGSAVVVGNFGVSPECGSFSQLRQAGYQSAVSGDMSTVMGSEDSNDNIWLSPALRQQCCAGEGDVVRAGLSHLAIPRGWGWGGLATSHCPVYVDIYSDTSSS